jgi:hypothetical protein
MDDLIQQITAKTGISDDQARQAIDMAMGFVKDKLPEPIASQLDGFIGGSGGSSDGGAGGMMGMVQGQLGGMMGGLMGGGK